MPKHGKLSRVRSAAGRAGAAVRWQGVEREPTVQVRIYEADAAWLRSRGERTVAAAVRRLRTSSQI